jgi:hypothetical protein
MKEKKNFLTKVAKGVAFGDVSNQAVRNILTELSKRLYGGITEQEMEDTLDAFGWKCPYTGRDLTRSILDGDGSCVTDHIEPQNKEHCGLNVKGNLIIVDKKANAAKRDQSVEDFLLKDTKVLSGVDEKTRQERLDKIKQFQMDCGYYPDKIRSTISPLMKKKYDEIRLEQEKCISDTLEELKKVQIYALAIKPEPSSGAAEAATTKKSPKRTTTNLIFHPAAEHEFKEKLLESKKARFVLTYDSGAIKTTPWDARNFEESSNLRGNIQSKTFWRNGHKEGLVKVEVFID